MKHGHAQLPRAAALTVLCAVGAATTSGAQEQAPTPRSLFSHAAELQAPGAELAGTLVRLPLDAEVLERASADLADVRVSADGGDVASFLRTRRSRLALEASFVPELIGALQSARVDDVTPAQLTEQIERYTLSLPDVSAPRDGWHLRLSVPAAAGDFTRRLSLSWRSDDSWRPFTETTVFRLAGGRQRLDIALPRLAGDALLVELSGAADAQGLEPLVPTFELGRSEQPAESTPLELPVELAASAAGYEFDLGAGFAPERFRIATSTGNFSRTATLFSLDAPDPVLLCRGTIERVRTQQSSTEDLVLDCAPSASRHYRLEIDDGDSPPLQDLSLYVQLSQPELVFEWPRASRVALLVGGGRARQPAFDFGADLGPVPRGGDSLAWALLSDATLPEIERGELRTNPDFDATPLLAFLQRAGTPVDSADYRFTSELALPPSDTGLHRIELAPEVLVHLLADLSDLRFQNDEGQWPYLLEPGPRWQLPLTIGAETDGRETRYRLDWPQLPAAFSDSANGLEVDQLRLAFAAPWFDRPYRIEQTGHDGSLVTSGRLRPVDVRTAISSPGTDQRQVTLTFSALSMQALELTIDNGDDAPLEIVEAEASGRGWNALLVAPAGDYAVLAGAVDPQTYRGPRYELERAANLVRSLRGPRVVVDDPQPNSGARSAPVNWQGILLWIAIAAAVLGLGWIVLRSSG